MCGPGQVSGRKGGFSREILLAMVAYLWVLFSFFKEHLWGLPLGQRLKDVRQKGAYLKGKNGEARRRQLDALGFNWTPKRGRPKKVT